MDQGVIRSLKAKYRSAFVQLYINRIESGKGLPKLNILDAMKFLVQSWNKVNDDTIKNCFKHAGISSAAQIDALEESDDPFKSLQFDLDELRTLDPTLVPAETTAEDYTDTNQALGVAESITVDDKEILSKYRKDLNMDARVDENADDDSLEMLDEDEPLMKPVQYEIYKAIEILMNCRLFEEEEVAAKMRNHLENFSSIYQKSEESKKMYILINIMVIKTTV